MERSVSFITISCAGKEEVYSLAQVQNMYDELRRELEEVTKSRSIDIKERLKEEFGDELTFASSSKEVCKSEFLFSSDSNLLYEFIKACASGTGIPRSIAIKTTAQMIHNSLRETQTLSKWPPIPQEIVESNDDIDTNLFNLISWILHPRGLIANNRRVMLPKSKAQKVLQTTRNITALLPNALPSKDEVLLSLTMHRKTESSDVVDTLHCLGHGISYSETLFVEDK